jgi:hypothetical protein
MLKRTDDNKLSSADSAKGKLQRIVLDLLREHERDGALPTSARFLFYELVQRGVISKEKSKDGARRPDQNLHDALFDLREAECVPWEWIVDETARCHRSRSIARQAAADPDRESIAGWRAACDGL